MNSIFWYEIFGMKNVYLFIWEPKNFYNRKNVFPYILIIPKAFDIRKCSFLIVFLVTGRVI